MALRVIAKKRDGFDGFNRAGFRFSSESETLLRDEETSDEQRDILLNEPMLLVVEVSDDEADKAEKDGLTAPELETQSQALTVSEPGVEGDGPPEGVNVPPTPAPDPVGPLGTEEDGAGKFNAENPAPITNDTHTPTSAGTPLPEGFPSKDALTAAGLTTVEAVSGVTDDALRSISGIGPASIQKIRDAAPANG